MLKAQGGYCLRTTEGDTVWFSVNSVSGEEENYRFVFLATMWPAA
jgi:hypothetical protein